MGSSEQVRPRQLSFADCLKRIAPDEAAMCSPTDAISLRVSVVSVCGMIDVDAFPMINVVQDDPDATHVVVAEALSGTSSFAFYPPETINHSDGRERNWRREFNGRASRYVMDHWEEISALLQNLASQGDAFRS